jgi:hypothetical protein
MSEKHPTGGRSIGERMAESEQDSGQPLPEQTDGGEDPREVEGYGQPESSAQKRPDAGQGSA